MDIAEVLSGGDRRSIGRSDQVAAFVLNYQSALPELIAALADERAVVRMRAADALEKVSAKEAGWLAPFAAEILQATESEDQELRWHAAQILPRLSLDRTQRSEAEERLFGLLDDASRIVRVFALTALVDLAQDDEPLRARLTPVVSAAAATGFPSMKARARKLINRLHPNSTSQG